jgi:DNA-binding response OmpR family regulator
MSVQGRLVLLVEDHDSTRKSLATLLARQGWEVLTAGTSEEAIALLVCTGTFDPERLEALRRLNPDALLQKPIDDDELFRACCSQGH